MRAEAVLELVEVERTYSGPPLVPALKECSLAIDEGDYVTIVGPSGSGKSTLLNILGLLDRPTSGQYLVQGADVGALSEHERTRLRGSRIGFVFQAFHLIEHRTAVENVTLGLLYRRVPAKARRERAIEALTGVGLGHRLDALPSTMSGGERQRVAIARALVGRPAVLLCDEPTGNLDSETTGSVLDLLDELHLAGSTVVVITHDIGVARRGNRCIRISDGCLSDVTAERVSTSAADN